MPRPDLSHPANAPGPWYVDTRCIRCDAARNWAPETIGMDETGRSLIRRQPTNAAEAAALRRAAAACPTKSIGNRDFPQEPAGVFPYELAAGVYALGSNARASFAAHSFLAVRPEGNLMIDAPRFSRALAERVDAQGGVAHILLTHRDDVADYARWAERYGARIWIGAADADAAPLATDVTGPDATVVIAPGVVSLPAPRHTAGHVVYHLDNRHLFTGDTLHWNQRRQELDVFPQQTFHSWAILADTMARLAALPVEGIFPGHGRWHNLGSGEWRRQLTALAPAMRSLGQEGWGQRPQGTYAWF